MFSGVPQIFPFRAYICCIVRNLKHETLPVMDLLEQPDEIPENKLTHNDT